MDQEQRELYIATTEGVHDIWPEAVFTNREEAEAFNEFPVYNSDEFLEVAETLSLSDMCIAVEKVMELCAAKMVVAQPTSDQDFTKKG